MQGRLSRPIENKIQCFPENSWESEFSLAEKIGFDLIEWVFDMKKNPIMDLEGVNSVKTCIKNHDIGVNAVCADYFMDNLLFSESENKIENLKIINLKDWHYMWSSFYFYKKKILCVRY